jgi:hypothetical protein
LTATGAGQTLSVTAFRLEGSGVNSDEPVG